MSCYHMERTDTDEYWKVKISYEYHRTATWDLELHKTVAIDVWEPMEFERGPYISEKSAKSAAAQLKPRYTRDYRNFKIEYYKTNVEWEKDYA